MDEKSQVQALERTLHYTPTYSSLLNQVEGWFGLINSARSAAAPSVMDLHRQIERFVGERTPG